MRDSISIRLSKDEQDYCKAQDETISLFVRRLIREHRIANSLTVATTKTSTYPAIQAVHDKAPEPPFKVSKYVCITCGKESETGMGYWCDCRKPKSLKERYKGIKILPYKKSDPSQIPDDSWELPIRDLSDE